MTNDQQEIMQTWTEYIKTQFQVNPEKLKPTIQHISNDKWKKPQKQIQEQIQQEHADIHTIRQNAKLTQMLDKNPHIKYWLTADYTEKEIRNTINKLKNNKAHGSDGIPAETYKALSPWTTGTITNMMNLLKNGAEMPEEWTEGAIVHIYKNKGNPNNCDSYRPI